MARFHEKGRNLFSDSCAILLPGFAREGEVGFCNNLLRDGALAVFVAGPDGDDTEQFADVKDFGVTETAVESADPGKKRADGNKDISDKAIARFGFAEVDGRRIYRATD